MHTTHICVYKQKRFSPIFDLLLTKHFFMVLCVVAKHVKSSWCDVAAMITFPGVKMDDSIRFNWRNNDPQVEKTQLR